MSIPSIGASLLAEPVESGESLSAACGPEIRLSRLDVASVRLRRGELFGWGLPRSRRENAPPQVPSSALRVVQGITAEMGPARPALLGRASLHDRR
jgi:hypothetical protein